MYEFQMIIMGD